MTVRKKATTKKRPKPAPKARAGELPAKVVGRTDLPAPHVGRPVKGCECPQCREHRRRNRQAVMDHAEQAVGAFLHGPMTVEAGRNASRALKDALGIE